MADYLNQKESRNSPKDKTTKEINADRLKKSKLKKLGLFEKDTGGHVDVYTDEDGLLTI